MSDKDQFNAPNLENGLEIEDIFNEGTLSVFEDFGADRALFNMVNNELIKLGGSEVTVYKFLSTENFDDLYDEDRIKALSPVPVGTYAHFDPVPIQENLSEFGLELTSELSFTFNREEIRKLLGRNLRAGDVIRPAFQNFFYAVYEVQEDSFESYGVYTLTAQARIWRDGDYIYKIRQQHPEFPPQAIIESTGGIILSDGYYMLVDFRYSIESSEVALAGGDKLPVMIVSHTGPSNRTLVGQEALKWTERGFFVILPDIRGRGESVARNDPRFRGRSYETSIRHRLDTWEVIECLYQGTAYDVGQGGQTPLVFEPTKITSQIFDRDGSLIQNENKGEENEKTIMVPHPSRNEFKLLMDLDNMHAAGFSLAGAVPLYMSVDSGLKYTQNMSIDKLVRYNYNTSTLEFGKSYMNPRSGAEDPENGFRKYSATDPYNPIDNQFPLQGFRTIKSIHAGGALIDAWGHVTEGEWDGGIKQHFSFFLYAKKGKTQWSDSLEYYNPDQFKGWDLQDLGIWSNPVCIFPVEYWWEKWDWDSLKTFFRTGKVNHSETELNFSEYGAIGNVPYAPSGMLHFDPRSTDAGVELPFASWVWPKAYTKSGSTWDSYTSSSNSPVIERYGWYRCMPEGLVSLEAGEIIKVCSKGYGGASFKLGRMYSSEDTEEGYQPNYENFGTAILPYISGEFDGDKVWFSRWYSSDTNIAFHMGYDDIIMSPVNNIQYFIKRAEQNKNAKTTFLCTHGVAHGTARSNKEFALIDKREKDWISYWARGVPIPIDNKNYLLSAVNTAPQGFVDYLPAAGMITVPEGEEYNNPDSEKFVSQFDHWPPPYDSLLRIDLDDPLSTTDYHRFSINHRLMFSSGDFENLVESWGEGIFPFVPTHDIPLSVGGVGDRDLIDPPEPAPGVIFRNWYRSNVEGYYKTDVYQHRMLVPSAIDINKDSYSQYKGYPGHYGEVPMVSSTNISWDGPVLNKPKTLLGSPSAVIDVSSNTGSFQIFAALYEVDPAENEKYVVGALYSQVDQQTTSTSNFYRAKFPLNPYYYKFSSGNRIRVKLWNMSIQQPPYEEGSKVEGIPGSKYPIAGGVFTGLPSFEEFELRIRIGGNSFLLLPINNTILKSPL